MRPKSTGKKSKNRVRSVSVARLTSFPRLLGLIRVWMYWMLVVFPDRPGP